MVDDFQKISYLNKIFYCIILITAKKYEHYEWLKKLILFTYLQSNQSDCTVFHSNQTPSCFPWQLNSVLAEQSLLSLGEVVPCPNTDFLKAQNPFGCPAGRCRVRESFHGPLNSFFSHILFHKSNGKLKIRSCNFDWSK